MAEAGLPPCVEACADGVLLHVRLTPRGGRDAVEGVEALANGRAVLKARVRAVPEDGAANKALLKLLAKWLEIPVSRIELAHGATARVKSFRIRGLSMQEMTARLLALA
ncbi:MAG: DUF167 domain-containing protein [Hyphomicrobiales bacterium]|nr:DUF167 domain-containing protein [Hyphomicrobiales bacterium]MDE2115276.1 DUF167 domain-containing protein [Hyphomicrobiales bacterium]